MNKETFSEQIDSLAACLFTRVDAEVANQYFKSLKHIQDETFRAICNRLKNEWSDKRFPLIGNFHDMYRQEVQKTQHPVDYGKDDETMPECTKLFFEVLLEIKEWHDEKLVAYHHPNCAPMTLEDWHKAGRPKTWSPIYDHFITGLYPNREDNFAGFCRKYLKELQDARAKRTAKAA